MEERLEDTGAAGEGEAEGGAEEEEAGDGGREEDEEAEGRLGTRGLSFPSGEV